MELTFDSLMARANDEPDAMYGLAAKSVWISPDKLTYRFTMRPEARFHDGSKMTAHDVAFSLNTLKEKGHPLIVVQLRDMVKAEALDDATVAVTLCAEPRARRPALCRGPADLLQGLLRDAAVRGIDHRNPARLRPLQGGPIRDQPLRRIRPGQGLLGGRSSRQPRQLQFRTVRYEFYRDRDVAFEGFTGKNYLYREEFTARIWATRYDFPGDQGRPRQARDPAG